MCLDEGISDGVVIKHIALEPALSKPHDYTSYFDAVSDLSMPADKRNGIGVISCSYAAGNAEERFAFSRF